MSSRVFGFTLLRNAVKYDYCFKESLESLLNVCEDVTIAFDRGEDETEKILNQLPRLHLVDSSWNMQKREGGIVLSEQTNIALEKLRKDKIDIENAWGFYLQADEVLHEEDRELILKDIELADQFHYDAISFRYLHFWQSHHSIAINKKWYPQEVRAVKLKTNIESWGDAQGFRNQNKIYQSEARIFHYGHVREEDKYLSKKADILKMYHSDQKLSKYKRREKKFDSLTETLPYWGPQPHWMKERVLRLGEDWLSHKSEEVFIVGDPALYSSKLKNNIHAENIYWVNSVGEVPKDQRHKMVIALPSFWQKLFFSSKVPLKMRSKLALPWNIDFILTLKLSEIGISVL